MRRACIAAIVAALSCGQSVAAGAIRLLPAAPPASRDVVVLDWQVSGEKDLSKDLTVRSLQGLVNRSRARIWVGLDVREGNPGWWLGKYREMGLVPKKPNCISADTFLRRYGRFARGAVVPPSNIGGSGFHVAANHASAEGLVIASAELARQMNLPIVADYSNRFANPAEAWQYSLERFWRRLNGKAIFVERDDLRNRAGTLDYVIQNRLFLCAPHRDSVREMELFRATLRRLPHNSPVIGSAGGGGMYSEGDIIREVSKAGCVFAGCSVVQNLSYHSALRPPKPLVQIQPRPTPKLDISRVYLAVEISDGDNANSYFTHFVRRGLPENRGRIPLGWTVGQAITELAPAVWRYYTSSSTGLDEFITGVSGHAYMFPGDFGNALSMDDKEAAWKEFLRRTDAFLDAHGMRTIATIQYQEAPGPIGTEVFRRFATLKRPLGIINGYNSVYNDYGGSTLEWVKGMPVFHTATDRTWSEPGAPTLADEVVSRTPPERPAFMALFMVPFPLTPEHFDQVVDSLKSLESRGYRLVLHSELADLARQASSR